METLEQGNLLVDEITTRKLILVRQLFYQARTRAKSAHNYVDRIMALIGFDLSVETLLKVIIGLLDNKSQSNRNLKFPEMTKKAAELIKENLKKELPVDRNISRIRSLRNDAQHEAKYPNPDDLLACQTYAKDYLDEVVMLVWNLNFETITTIELIQHDELKHRLREAHQAFGDENYLEAIKYSMLAYELAKVSLKTPLLGSGITQVGSFDKVAVQTFQSIAREIENVRNYLLLALVGIDVKEHVRFRSITKNIKITQYGPEMSTITLMNRGPVTMKEAEFVVEYVTNAVLKYESFAGDLKNPIDLSILE